MLVPLLIKGEKIGVLTLRVWEEGRYTEQQAELLGSVAKPFAIALANASAHEEVVRYRDILLDDNRFLNRELCADVSDEIFGGSTGLRNVMEMVHQLAPLPNTLRWRLDKLGISFRRRERENKG